MEHTITKFISTCACKSSKHVGFVREMGSATMAPRMAHGCICKWPVPSLPARSSAASIPTIPRQTQGHSAHRDADVAAVAAVAGRHFQQLVARRLSPWGVAMGKAGACSPPATNPSWPVLSPRPILHDRYCPL